MNGDIIYGLCIPGIIFVYGVGICIGIFVDKRNQRRERLIKLGVGGKQAKSLIK